MKFFIGIFLFLIVVFGYILFLKNIFKYNFGKSLFFSTMIIMFLNSIFSLFDILNFGRIVIVLFGFISFIFNIVYSIIKKEKLFLYFKNYSFLIFILGLIVIFGASYKVDILMGWDECSYWATMVKRLFYSNSYLDVAKFHPMYYPPSLTSYNYFTVKFLGMTDNSIYFSQYFLILSACIYFIRNIKFKQFLYGLCNILILILFLILLLEPYILTLYSEIPLILIAGIGCSLIIINEDKYDMLFAFVMLFNATLIKSNGLIVCILPMLIMFFKLLNLFIKNYKKYYKNFVINFFVNSVKLIKTNLLNIFVFLAPLLAQFCFNIYLKINNISNPQAIPNALLIQLINFIKLIIKKDAVVNNYFNALSNNYNYSTFNMSTIVIFAFFIFVLIYFKNKQSDDEVIKSNKYIIWGYILSFVIYVFALLYSYCFMFSKGESLVLASYDRYINSFLGAAGIGIFSILLYFFENRKKYDKFILYILLLLLTVVKFSSIMDFGQSILFFTKSSTNENIILGKQISEKYSKCFDENDKIHFIIQGNYGLGAYSTIYYMTPLKIYDPRFDGDNWSIRIDDSINEENSTIMSSADYINYLNEKQFTHVLVIKNSYEFNKGYSDVFETRDGNILEGVYKFDKLNGKLLYEECE